MPHPYQQRAERLLALTTARGPVDPRAFLAGCYMAWYDDQLTIYHTSRTRRKAAAQVAMQQLETLMRHTLVDREEG
jgi:hypothetical protein